MEVKNMSGRMSSCTNEKVEYDDVPLPGFRFHPTDEELVGFYLRRKVEKRPAAIELIKQADIYKYDPWDLPKSNNAEDQKEWYFFCRRGRKYKNSIRPNRVTGSGFWKATGIDRPIYKGRECIGLKKSLVYYRGSAGKGTKTEWMMHEFRLPPTGSSNTKTTNIHMDAATIAQEAEVWTLCRILKRNVPYRKSEYNFRNNINEVDAKRSKNLMINSSSSVTCSMEFSCDQNNKNIAESKCISFQQIEKKPFFRHLHHQNNTNTANDQQSKDYCIRPSSALSYPPSNISDDASLLLSDNPSTDQFNELLMHVEWEDLQSILDCTACF